MSFQIVLVNPEIPANTGNISRTCAATHSALHLVRPLGFSTDDRYLKRAGLDYWDAVDLNYHDSFEELEAKLAGRRFFLATTKATKYYHEYEYQPDDVFVFGRETAGLPAHLLERYPEHLIKIPIGDAVRSLNLSNAVAIVLYEALRQTNFPNLRSTGY
jgi:tRNA (cytidine/uridine-2'-O-)-methyltransferase